jgi:hypothetical protein
MSNRSVAGERKGQIDSGSPEVAGYSISVAFCLARGTVVFKMAIEVSITVHWHGETSKEAC